MIANYKQTTPQIADSCFIAPSSDVLGRVTLEDNVSIWFGAVVRADVNDVLIKQNSNVQDNAVIHQSDKYPCIIGAGVTIGHGAIVHACTIEDNVLVGMGAIILDGAYIERDVLIGAGALVPPGTRVPAGSLVVGSPAKVKRQLDQTEIDAIAHSATKYVGVANDYKKSGR